MDITAAFDKRPCKGAIKWMRTQTDLHTAWEVCDRGDWLWWSLRHSEGNMPSKEVSGAYTRACVERAKNHIATDAAFQDAVFTAEAAGWVAVYAAEYAADAAYAAYTISRCDAETAAKAAYDAELQWQADWIREHIPNPF